MLKRLTILTIIVMLVVAVVPFAGAQDEADLSGTEVVVFGAYTDESEVNAFEAGFADFEAETGIDVIYEGSSDFEVIVQTRVDAGDPPDIAGFPQPGLMNRFAEEAIDVTSFLDMEYLQGQYNQSWLDMATASDGSDKMIGIWGRVVVKSLVWYNPIEFEIGGYEIPQTWDELLALSDQMVADGMTPWNTPMESGNATGWVGTDWVEDIMLRTASLESYDNWATPASADERLAFTSPEVTRAWELMSDVLLTEGYVLGGVDQMLNVPFFDTGNPIITGEAMMAKMGSFMPPWIDVVDDFTIAPDGDIYYFFFPPIDEEFGSPVLVSGDIYTMFNDRPEVRAVMEHLTTAESLRPAIEEGIFIAPHNDQDISWYREAEAGIADILLNADAFRFDGGDLMPGAVGTGTFWAGIVDYLNGEDLGPILESIDESWPE